MGPAAVALLTLMERRLTAGVASQEPDRHCGRAPCDKGRTRTCNSGWSAPFEVSCAQAPPLGKPDWPPLPVYICFPRTASSPTLSLSLSLSWSSSVTRLAPVGCYSNLLSAFSAFRLLRSSCHCC
uniref:Secreted protein n=1 Tax=Plectus sambesii TaxID=2011161 RepID=A0A914WJH1_9BILA